MRRSLVVVVLMSLTLVVAGVPAGAVTQRERTTRDELQNILRGLDDLRRFVIDGDAYTAFFEATSLASGDSTVVQLSTGDTDIFFFQTAFTSNAANVEIRFHESPSIAGGETVEIPTFNLNRQATDTS